MNASHDLKSASAARLHGERMGHLSRIGRADLLAEEMAALADMAAGQINLHAFRKAFFGAGGRREHWEKYAAMLVETPAPPAPAARPPLPFAPQPAPPPAPPPAPAAEQPRWQELEAALGAQAPVAVTPTPPQPPVPPPVQAPAPVPGAEGAPTPQISVTPLPGEKVAIVVRGVFGAAGYGGREVARLIEEYLRATPADVVLDLRAVESLRVDSTAAFINCQMKARAHGCKLVIVKPRGAGGALLDAMGLSSRIECLPEEEAASLGLLPPEE